MAQPVWVLSVDLQTKTATFQSGMADAAKTARGSLNDIKQGAGEMARDTGTNMMEARHGVMLLGEEFGVHLPRALTTFIASLGPIGAAMEAAFPFLAILVGATLLIEHLSKLKEEGEKLTEAQLHFGAVTANVLNDLDQKLLQAGIRADELNGNHLAALEKQLQIIDHQSLKELEQSFEVLAKASDAYMSQLKTHWYQFGTGSAGAQHALDEFKQKYDLLLAQGKDKEASDLLSGTLQSAQRVLDLQKQSNDLKAKGAIGGQNDKQFVEYLTTINQLRQSGTGNTEKEVQAQQTLVDGLKAQVEAEQKVHDLHKLEASNAKDTTQKTIDADDDKIARQQSESYKRELEQQDKMDEDHYRQAVENIQQAERLKIDATKEGSAARLAVIDEAIKNENTKGLQETEFYKTLLRDRVNTQRQLDEESKRQDAGAKLEAAQFDLKMGELRIAAEREHQAVLLQTKKRGDHERVKSDMELAEEEFQAKMKCFRDEIAALDKDGKDYENRLRAIQNREKELIKAHENEKTRITEEAERKRVKEISDAERSLEDSIARGLTSTLMRHQSFAAMMGSIGSGIASGMMQNVIKSAMMEDFGKEKEAAHAARLGFLAGMKLPFPANIVMGPVLGAAAFASVMAFQGGGLVPGVELGDVVNAKLEPGESVLPKKMTEQLNRAANPDEAGGHTHLHIHQTNHLHAIDSTGVKQMLDKHKDEFSRHFHSELRRMNR